VRFNSPEHLLAWRDTGRFPAIHDAIANMAVANMRGRVLMDLGCSYGLLGHRIAQEMGGEVTVIGVEVDAKVIAAAEEACVGVRFHTFKVERASLQELRALAIHYRVDTIVARRILPELFGDDRPAGVTFASDMAASGVWEMFIEGRVATVNAVNPLRSIADEVDLVAGSYREVRRAGAVSYLVAR
jgi:hypothetical protein